MKLNVCCVYWVLLSISFVSSCLLFILVATESSVIDSSVQTLGYNDTVDSEILAKNPETVEKYSEQQRQNVRLSRNEKDQSKEVVGDTHQEGEHVAEIHSSFEDVVSLNNVEISKSVDAASFIVPPESVTDVNTELFEAGQSVVFTLVDSVSAELQDHASSASHHHSEGLLMENRNSSPAAVTSPVETQIVRPQISDDESLPNNEETSKNLSILEDAVDDRIFQERDQQYIVRAEPKVIEVQLEVPTEKLEGIIPEADAAFVPDLAATTNDSRKVAETGKDDDVKLASTDGSEQTPEDIPSFSEWAQKQLAEAEKKKVQNSTAPPTGHPSRSSGNLKIRSKNYASPDCGAKIVTTNPEAMYAGSIISPSRDEYVLNACANRFWFVVELCEAIQAKKIDLANFELFSSSPRDFSVWLSDRFPSRDWRNVGHFTAQDERDIQSFNLAPHLFGKFIKVELHSHYGSEHYCPISLFRVYGTSEFEVLETEVEVHESVPDVADDDDDDDDSDDEEHLDLDTGEPPKTLFGSAQDAVMSIVKKAAQALVKGGDSQNSTATDVEVKSHSDSSGHKTCANPSHIVVCDNCSDAMYSKVFGLLSCQWTSLQSFIDLPFVRDSFRKSKVCVEYGFDFSYHRTGAPYPSRPSASVVDPLQSSQSRYLSALLPSEYIAALCNILAVLDKKVVLNVSYEVNGTTSVNLTSSLDGKSLNAESHFENLVSHPTTPTLGSSLTSQQCNSLLSDSCNTIGFSTSSLPLDTLSAETVASQIKPTKTLVKEPDVKEDFPLPATMKTTYDQIQKSTVLPEISSVQELPSGVSSTVTVSVCPGEENRTGARSLKDSVEVEAESPVHDSEFFKVEMTEELPTFTEVDQQQAGVNEKQNDMMFEEKYYQEGQDSLSLDSFLSELKDVDMGLDTSSSSAVTPASVTATTVLPQTQQVQKESVFVRLSNRIKALERNMSLSGQYLEELSRRYKKQVEEMQRAFNRTLAALAEESHKGNEREQKRVVEMAALQKQLTALTFTVDMLLLERDSWHHKAAVVMQHVVFIIIEVIVFGIILYFCLHLTDTGFVSAHRKWSFGWHNQKGKESKAASNCQRSIEAGSGHEAPKTNNFRPSVEPLNVSGTCSNPVESHTLEIDDGSVTVPKTESKRRRRRRKDAVRKSSSSANFGSRIGRRVSEHASGLVEYVRNENEGEPTRRASSSELGNWWSFSNGTVSDDDEGLVDKQSVTDHVVTEHNGHYSPIQHQEVVPVMINAASASGREFSSGEEKVDLSQEMNLKVEGLNARTKDKFKRSIPILHQGNGSVKSAELGPKVQFLSPPVFMKTAMSARNNRIGKGTESNVQARLKSDNWEWYSSHRTSSVTSDKSNQGTVPPAVSSSTLNNGGAHSVNGHSEHDEWDRTNKARECQSASVSQRNSVKKTGGSSGLKKMVRKFF